MDGASPHFGIDVLLKAKSMGLELIALPSHTTHLLQPMDVACIKPINAQLMTDLLEWQLPNPHKCFNKTVFPPLLKGSYVKMTLKCCQMHL